MPMQHLGQALLLSVTGSVPLTDQRPGCGPDPNALCFYGINTTSDSRLQESKRLKLESGMLGNTDTMY
jgi:hypothetical protein